MMAMMGSISVAMAEGTLGMSPFTILPGEEKTVAVNLNQDGDILSLQADIALPDGLSLVKWQTNAERIDRDAHAVTLTRQTDGQYRLTVFPKTLNPIFGNDGALVELTLKADASFTHKGTMDFSNIHLVSTDNSRFDQDNFSVLASSAPTSRQSPSPPTSHTPSVSSSTTVCPSMASRVASNSPKVLPWHRSRTDSTTSSMANACRRTLP